MLKIAVGHSIDPDSSEAVHEVLGQCLNSLAGHHPKAGLLFAAIDFDHALILQRINEVFPGIALIGGTTDGELSSVLEFQQDSLTLVLFCSEDIDIQAFIGRNLSQNPTEVARQAAQSALTQVTSPKFCIALPESLTTSATSILHGLELGLGGIPIFGGATADQWRYQQTYQFYKTEVLSDSVPLLVFGGPVLFSYGCAGGWHPIGKQSVITEVNQNVIYEIDDKPALDFYHYYLNVSEPDAVYPLAVFPPGEDKFFLRGAVGYDSTVGSITVSGDAPERSIVQITDASLEDIVIASQVAFTEALKTYRGEKPEVALFFSCAWRRQILGTRANEEYRATKQCAKYPIPACGFYTYGELAPLKDQGKTFFHNTTFVALIFGTW